MDKEFQIVILPGDGIGPEIMEEAVKLLRNVEEKEGVRFHLSYERIGGDAIDHDGTPLPEQTLNRCREADAVLLGAVGGPKWDDNPPELRPEKGLLAIRKGLDIFANLRPAFLYDAMKSVSSLKEEVVRGVDIMVVRELTGGIYFGEKTRETVNGQEMATDKLSYTEQEIERVVRQAFEIARKRKNFVTSVDKANVLESSRLWRSVVDRVAKDYPDVQYQHMLVDACAMEIIRSPRQFDVIVTENMFGDILSDEASMLTGSIGMLPSASMGDGTFGLYEPVHGSAPDIAGENIANPVATILSTAMMLRYSLGLTRAADEVDRAVEEVLQSGVRTMDIAESREQAVTTSEMGDQIVAAYRKQG
ncbi:MAG: 3-isopropylmalate dehydrogenase [Bacillaceae bacterium]|nr:3-isopropylmalate dehydrogenase [Bacillaceae bacterium]